MKKINLPSGAILEISSVPFGLANTLNKAVAKELKTVHVSRDLDLLEPDFIKNLAFTAIVSDEIEKALEPILKRCTYNNLKIDDSLFEKESAREDYYPMIKEIIIEVTSPFAKGLLSLLKTTLQEKKA